MSTLKEKQSQVSNFYTALNNAFQELLFFENCLAYKNALINFNRQLQDFKAGKIAADIIRQSKDEVYGYCLKAIDELRARKDLYFVCNHTSLNEIYDIVMCEYYTTINEYKGIILENCNHLQNN